MSDTPQIKETKAHCNQCGGNRTHKLLLSEESMWKDDDDDSVYDVNTYHMLKCGGCASIKLRLEEWWSDGPIDEEGNPIPGISYYPPAVFRQRPRWLVDLMLVVSWNDGNIHDLLAEIYVALQNDQRTLAAMGIRALLEKIMVEKSGDHGTFATNLKEFENQGYVSRIQRERLETILEAGHAAMHRLYKPSKEDLITLVDIAESVVESIYIHGAKVEKLKGGIPLRVPKSRS